MQHLLVSGANKILPLLASDENKTRLHQELGVNKTQRPLAAGVSKIPLRRGSGEHNEVRPHQNVAKELLSPSNVLSAVHSGSNSTACPTMTLPCHSFLLPGPGVMALDSRPTPPPATSTLTSVTSSNSSRTRSINTTISSSSK